MDLERGGAQAEGGRRVTEKGSDGWRPAQGGAISRRLSPTAFFGDSEILLALEQPSARQLVRRTGGPAPYCALNLGGWERVGGQRRKIKRGKFNALCYFL